MFHCQRATDGADPSVELLEVLVSKKLLGSRPCARMTLFRLFSNLTGLPAIRCASKGDLHRIVGDVMPAALLRHVCILPGR